MEIIKFSEEKYDELKWAAQEYINYVKSDDLDEHYLEKYLCEIEERTFIFLFGPKIFEYVGNRLEETLEKEHGGEE